MSDLLVLSVVVDGLELENLAAGYEIITYGPGESQVRRKTYESPDVAGRLVIATARETMLGKVAVRVYGATAAQVDSRMEAAKAKFDQDDYVLTATIASTRAAGNRVESWQCERADWAEGDAGIVDAERLWNLCAEVTFTFPHDPVRL